MKTNRRWTDAIEFVLLLIVLTVFGCGKGGGGKSGKAVTWNKNVWFKTPITYCMSQEPVPARSDVQVLMDASGSMVGYQKASKEVLSWLKSAVSRLNGSQIELNRFRVAYFNRQNGLHSETTWNQPLRSYRPSGDTNLDEAIQASSSFDISFIITDGVAATGSFASAQCAGGVDAACVAKALYEFLHPVDPDQAPGRGVWMIPMTALYSGKFYTEERLQSFDSRQAIDNIKSEVGFTARIGGIGQTSTGEITFDYEGPRALVLIVLSKNESVGRATVGAIMDAASTSGVERLKEFKDFKGKLGVFMPIELYPGFIYPLRWTGISEPYDKANLSAKLGSDGVTLRASAVSGKPEEEIFELTGTPSIDILGAGCDSLSVLPAFEIGLQETRHANGPDLESTIKAVGLSGEDHMRLRLLFSSSLASSTDCANNPLEVQYVATVDYKKTADMIATGEIDHTGIKLLHNLGTRHPSQEPHRIYNFTDLVRLFFQRVSSDQQKMALATLKFCFD